MLKKRIIFTLLYDSGYFMLSRNFRLQRVGNLDWLQRNYNFDHIAFFIDELIILNVSRSEHDVEKFSDILKSLTARCFVPIAAGGGIRSINDANRLLRSGADKVVVNTPLFKKPKFVKSLAQEFGQQCIVGAVDVKYDIDIGYRVFIDNGINEIEDHYSKDLSWINDEIIGELYLNSMDRDGTGQGYDFRVLDILPKGCSIPVILAGGVGNGTHLFAGLQNPLVDAVATAHLFNFVGDGLQKARESLLQKGVSLAQWLPLQDFYGEFRVYKGTV